MAFHPFKHFRKHQKVYLAGLTIMTMIIFVFSFGAADPFQSALRWIGLTSHHGDPVLKLYGKTLYTDDLDKVRWQRQLASEFLLFGAAPPQGFFPPLALGKSIQSIQKRFGGDPSKGPMEEPSNPVREALRIMQEGMMSSFQVPPDMRLNAYMNSLRRVEEILATIENNPEQASAVDAIATRLAIQAWLFDPQRRPNDFYFGGSPRTEELLDFLVWKQQADKLGIVLTPADVSRAVNRAWGNDEFLKPDGKFESNELVVRFFQTNQKIQKRLTPRDLLDALTDEFRVSLAQQALLGKASGVRAYRDTADAIHHSPAAATPDEFYKYYQDQRTTLAVSMLPIAVEDFVKKVQAKPSEEDLRNLYERYKDEEPSPSRRQAGFKQPRRVKVQYFSYRPEGPFAKKVAAKATELLPLFYLGEAANPFPAGGGVAHAARLAAPIGLETHIHNLYQQYRREEANRALKYDKRDDSSFQPRFGQGVDLSERSRAEAQAPLSALGKLLGVAGTGGTPLAVPVTLLATNEVYERATAAAFASTMLAGASSSPLTAITLPTRYLHSAQPLEAVRARMIESFENGLAKEIMAKNAENVREEIDKLLKPGSEQKLDEYVKNAVAEHGLENYHSMNGPQTRQEILDDPDPALKELQTAYDALKDHQNPFPRERPRPDFASAMLHDFTQTPRGDEQGKAKQPFRSHQFLSQSGEENWVYWRSEDHKARRREFVDIRDQVKDAWYLEQARKLARDEARRIDDELKQQRLAPADAVKFLREQKQGEVFELTNVAHLQSKVTNVLPGHKFTASDFQPYVVPKERIAYPPDNFVAQLLLKLKERGDSLVIADRPVRHFYVAVLMEKPQVPERREFYAIYNNSRGPDNLLWTKMIDARQLKYAEKVIEQLRAEATKDLEGGEYIIPEKVRSRGESGGESTE
ncbi:MAG TPA: hypothetical protein VH575_25095 [Gemmataceae bacterium]